MLSVIIPTYNEEKTIAEIIKRVSAVNLEKELIIVDDGSTDKTAEILAKIKQSAPAGVIIIRHKKNLGKGSAIRTGLEYAKGDIIVIQDADLENDPNDYYNLIKPIREGRAKVVYGSRNLPASRHQNAGNERFFYKWGGIFLSWLANFLYSINITDEPTCYKVFKADIIKGLNLKCRRFEFCPEVTAKIAKMGCEIIEVPISYFPRGRAEGKKMKISDGFKAAWILVKHRFVD